MEILVKDEDKCTIAVGLNDADGDCLLRNATAVFAIHVSDYFTWKRNIEFCKDYNQHSMTQECYIEIDFIDTEISTVVDAVKNNGKTIFEVKEEHGDAKTGCSLVEISTCVNDHNEIAIQAEYKHVGGYATTDPIHITELSEVFKPYLEKEVKEAPEPKITREDFMEFWRSDAMPEVLTIDDRMEIFASAPVGASDITKETLDEILEEYQVNNLNIEEVNMFQLDRLTAETFYAFANDAQRVDTMDQEGYEINYGEGYIHAPIDKDSFPSLEDVFNRAFVSVGIEDTEAERAALKAVYDFIVEGDKKNVVIHFSDNASIPYSNIEGSEKLIETLKSLSWEV